MSEEDKRLTWMGIGGMAPFKVPRVELRMSSLAVRRIAKTNNHEEEVQNLRNDVLLLKEMMFKERGEKQVLKDLVTKLQSHVDGSVSYTPAKSDDTQWKPQTSSSESTVNRRNGRAAQVR